MTEAIVGELSDLLWERVLARDPLTALRLGRPVEALPLGGSEAVAENVSFAVSMLGRLAGIGGVDAAFLRDHLEQEAAEAQRFWYRFPVTPYNASAWPRSSGSRSASEASSASPTSPRTVRR